MTDRPSVLVIGAGIVGIACGIHLIERGAAVTLIDPEPPGSLTSSGNAGGLASTEVMPIGAPGVIKRIPGWLLDPLGPLSLRWRHLPSMLPWLVHFRRASTRQEVERISKSLSTLLGRSMQDTRELVYRARLQNLITERGAITVYESEKSRQLDALEWRIKRERGITVEALDAFSIKQMEPALHNVSCGYFTPQWCNTVSPGRLAGSLASFLHSMGAKFVRARVEAFHEGDPMRPVVLDNTVNRWDKVIVAAGVWSAELCRLLNESVLLESERGYNTTLPAPGVSLNRQIIFGDRKFVVTEIEEGLRIGGAAEFAGVHAPPDFRRSERLLEIAKTYLPDLNISDGKSWMGHRPSTPDSLPVISKSIRHPELYYAFGHGHIGLTTAATTGHLIAQLAMGEKPDIDLSPYSIGRF